MSRIPADPERGAPEIVVGADEVPIDALMSVAFDRRPVRLSSDAGWAARVRACRAVLEKCGINPMARPGELSQADYVRLADAI